MICLMGIGDGRVLLRTTDGSVKDVGTCRSRGVSWPAASSTSNMEMSEVVGGIGCESTASKSCSAFTLCIRRGFRSAVTVGLPPRLAASVAAMRLGFLAAATVAGSCGDASPRARCGDGDVE